MMHFSLPCFFSHTCGTCAPTPDIRPNQPIICRHLILACDAAPLQERRVEEGRPQSGSCGGPCSRLPNGYVRRVRHGLRPARQPRRSHRRHGAPAPALFPCALFPCALFPCALFPCAFFLPLGHLPLCHLAFCHFHCALLSCAIFPVCLVLLRTAVKDLRSAAAAHHGAAVGGSSRSRLKDAAGQRLINQ